MKNKKIACAIALIASLWLAHSASAQTTSAEAAKVDSAAKQTPAAVAAGSEDAKSAENSDKAVSGGTLAPVQITAMRFKDSIYESTATGVNISAQQISDSNVVSATQLLNRYSDVYIRNMGGGEFMGQISMRGFGANSQSRTLVLVDGQRLNTPDMAGINWATIQLDDIENVEVLYGAQTATYGGFAEAGVVKFTTKKWGKNGAKVKAQFGEYGEYGFSGSADYSTEDYYASVGATYYHNSGFFANSLNWNKSATVSAGMKLDSKNEIGAYVNFGNMAISWPGYIYAANVRDFREQYPDNLNHYEEDFMQFLMASTSWENKTSFGEGSAHLGLNIRDKDVDNVGSNHALSTLWTLSFDPKYRVYFGSEDESYVEGGVDFYYDHLDAHTNNGTYNTDVDRYTVSPWVGAKAQLDDVFSLNGALRYEAVVNSANSDSAYYKLDDSELVNGFAAQFGANAKLDESWNVYFRFDQLYHYPSIDERYSLWGYGAGYTNPNLDPEHGQNYEIGTNFAKFGFSAAASLYYTRLNNEIAYDGINYINKNIGDTERYGMQLRVGYEYDKLCGVFTSWNFVDAKYTSGVYCGNKVALVPTVSSKSGVWVKPIDYVMVELNYIWANSQYQEGYLDAFGSKERIPENYSLDLTVNVYPCEYARLFFAVANLTDHRNCSYATFNCWYPEPGRTIRCGLELRF